MRSYFKSKEFFLTLLGIIVGSVLLLLFIFYVFLPSYTKHGSSVVVPDVGKLNYKEAILKLEKAGLDVEIRDSMYFPNMKAQTVLKQNPLPASTVKPGRTVYLTLNKTVAPMVKMPKIVDMSVYQAKARLESWKLQVDSIVKIPDIAKNVVLKAKYRGKDVREGTELPQGAAIVLYIGKGLDEKLVEVPNVTGMTYSQALAELGIAGLGMNPVYDGRAGNNLIYDQYPKAEGDSVKQGWTIDVFIHGKEPEGVEATIIDDNE